MIAPPREITGRAEIILAMALGCLGLVLVAARAPLVVAVPAGFLTLLLLPGFVWLRAIPPSDLSPFGFLMLMIGVSCAITMVVGVAINALPPGLTREMFCIGQAVALLLGGAVALIRHPQRRIALPFAVGLLPFGRTLLQLAVLGGLVALAVSVSVSSQRAENAREHFTVLAVRAAGNHPLVTVTDHQGVTMRYGLAVSAGAGTESSLPLRLLSGQTVIVRLAVNPPQPGGAGRLSIVLTRPGQTGPFRAVWLHAKDGAWR